MTATACRTPFPMNKLTLAKADKLIELVRTKGAHWLIDYAHHHNMTRQEMRNFIAWSCSEPEPKEAA